MEDLKAQYGEDAVTVGKDGIPTKVEYKYTSDGVEYVDTIELNSDCSVKSYTTKQAAEGGNTLYSGKYGKALGGGTKTTETYINNEGNTVTTTVKDNIYGDKGQYGYKTETTVVKDAEGNVLEKTTVQENAATGYKYETTTKAEPTKAEETSAAGAKAEGTPAPEAEVKGTPEAKTGTEAPEETPVNPAETAFDELNDTYAEYSTEAAAKTTTPEATTGSASAAAPKTLSVKQGGKPLEVHLNKDGLVVNAKGELVNGSITYEGIPVNINEGHIPSSVNAKFTDAINKTRTITATPTAAPEATEVDYGELTDWEQLTDWSTGKTPAAPETPAAPKTTTGSAGKETRVNPAETAFDELNDTYATYRTEAAAEAAAPKATGAAAEPAAAEATEAASAAAGKTTRTTRGYYKGKLEYDSATSKPAIDFLTRKTLGALSGKRGTFFNSPGNYYLWMYASNQQSTK